MGWPQEVIEDVMKECEVDPKTVKGKSRVQLVHGFGFFRCKKCQRSWASNRAWIRINLRKQKIIYRFSQKCTGCDSTVKAELTSESLVLMVIYVCDRYLGRPKGKPGEPPDTGSNKKPHLNQLCEKCNFGKGPNCWALPKTKSEPKKKSLPGTKSEPEKKSLPETKSEPEKKSLPETESEPEKKSLPETKSEPEKKRKLKRKPKPKANSESKQGQQQ